jgi:hypothetical protein
MRPLTGVCGMERNVVYNLQRARWINCWDEDDLELWQRRLGVSRERLLTAIIAVGAEASSVRRWVRYNRDGSGRADQHESAALRSQSVGSVTGESTVGDSRRATLWYRRATLDEAQSPSMLNRAPCCPRCKSPFLEDRSSDHDRVKTLRNFCCSQCALHFVVMVAGTYSKPVSTDD